MPGVDRQHLGDEIRDERAQRQDQRGLVAGADPVGLEPDPTMGAIGPAEVIGDDVGPRPVVDLPAGDDDRQAEVSA